MEDPEGNLADGIHAAIRRYSGGADEAAASRLASVLADLVDGDLSGESAAEQIRAIPQITRLKRSLTGKSVQGKGARIEFCAGAQLGDVKIGQIAGGDIYQVYLGPGSRQLRPWLAAIVALMIVVPLFQLLFGPGIERSLEPPEAEQLYFAILLDATQRMTASYAGSEDKWTVAQRSLATHFRILPSRAHYALVSLGGEQAAPAQGCAQPDAARVAFAGQGLGSRRDTRDRVMKAVTQLRPSGEASLTRAIGLAVEELATPAQSNTKTLFLIVGGGDSCDPDQWSALFKFLGSSIGRNQLYAELIILGDESVPQGLEERLQGEIVRLGLEHVAAHVPRSPTELDETLRASVTLAQERARLAEPTAVAVEETIVAVTAAALAEPPQDGVAAGAAPTAPAPTAAPATATAAPASATPQPATRTARPTLAAVALVATPQSPSPQIIAPPTAAPTLAQTAPAAPPPPTRTPLPTEPPPPTSTPLPTDTPPPTDTALPSATPSASALPTAMVSATALPPTIAPTAPPPPTALPTETPTLPPTEEPTSTATEPPTAAPSPSVTPTGCQSSRPPLQGPAPIAGSATIQTPAGCTTGIPAETGFSAAGAYADLPAGHVVWLLVYSPEGLYYPQSPDACSATAPTFGGGSWDVPTYLGKSGGPPEWFDLVLVFTDPAASQFLGAWVQAGCQQGYAGYVGIPAAELLARNISEKAAITVQTVD